VGHNQNPLDQTGTSYLYNNSNYDLAFDKICVKPFGDTAAMQG